MNRFERLKIWLRKIRTQISILFAVGSLLPVVVLGYVIYYNISEEYVSSALSSAQKTLFTSGEQISLYLDKIKLFSSFIASDEKTIYFLSNQDEGGVVELETYLQQLVMEDEYIQSIIIIGKDGRIASNESDLKLNLSNDLLGETWYQNAIKNDMPTLAGAMMRKFTMNRETWVISLNQEVESQSGEHLGLIIIDLKYDFINDFINEKDLGNQGYIYILDDKEYLVYHPDTSYFESKTKLDQLVAMSHMDQGYHQTKQTLVYQLGIKDTQWILIGVAYLEGLVGLQQQLGELIFLTGLLALVGSILLGLFFAGRIAKPVSNQEKSLKELQINALIGQINPHFLYNTLDTIVWMAEFEENDKVIQLTKSLATFFRISLSRGKELIPLCQEIEHVKQYLFIQKQRYGDKLSYEIELEEEIEELLIPKIILQPLVENSIYHGIKHLDGNGRIKIECKNYDEKIQILVQDNGVGFDIEEKIDENSLRLSGIGLTNVRKRLEFYFGQGVVMRLDSMKGQGTCAIIEIQKKSMDGIARENE